MAQSPLLHSVNTEVISGLPWVTSSFVTGSVSSVEIDFPWVTKRVTLMNTGSVGSLAIAFTPGGFSTSNFWTVAPGETFSLDCVVKAVWLAQTGSGTRTNYQMSSILTTTDVSSMPALTGSIVGSTPIVGNIGTGNGASLNQDTVLNGV